MVLLRVQLAADASAPQVRAFVVVKTLSALSGFVDATPSGEALRQKELPEFIRNRQLDVRFAAGANVDDAVARARGCQGVADVRVERPEHQEREPEAAKAMTPNAEVHDPGADGAPRRPHRFGG